jgi:hypothetical protein
MPVSGSLKQTSIPVLLAAQEWEDRPRDVAIMYQYITQGTNPVPHMFSRAYLVGKDNCRPVKHVLSYISNIH